MSKKRSRYLFPIGGEAALEWVAQILDSSTLAFCVASRAASLMPSEELLRLIVLGAARWVAEEEVSMGGREASVLGVGG